MEHFKQDNEETELAELLERISKGMKIESGMSDHDCRQTKEVRKQQAESK